MNPWLSLTAILTPEALESTPETVATGTNDFTVLFCIIALLVCIAIPLVTVLIGILKYEGKVSRIFLGMLGFLGFSTLLYAVVSSIVLSGYSDQTASSFEATVLIVVRVFCETVGMFLILWLLKKKASLGNAINFAAGYCIMECFLIAFLLVGFLVVATSEDISTFAGGLRSLRIYIQDNNLVLGEEWKFLIRAFTAAVFCCLDICSVLVIHRGIEKKMYWMALIPIVFGLLIRIPNRMHSFDAWFWGNYAVILPYLAIVSVVIVMVTYSICKNQQMEELGEV